MTLTFQYILSWISGIIHDLGPEIFFAVLGVSVLGLVLGSRN